jgi:hypothetical protein
MDASEPPSRIQVVSETARAHRHRYAATLCPRVGSCAPGANAAHRKTRQADRPRRGADQPADHSTNGQVDTITEAYWISLKIGTTTIRGKFHHLPHLPSDLVRRYPFSIDLKKGSPSLRPPTAADEVQPTQAQPAFQVSNSPPLTLSPNDEEQRLRQFLAEELPLFDTVQGLTPLVQHEIRLLHPEPMKQRYRPRNPFMQGIIDEEVDKMSAEGVIEPSDSPWSSPIVLAKKKDGKHLFCIDFRKVNEVTRMPIHCRSSTWSWPVRISVSPLSYRPTQPTQGWE